MPVPTVTVTPAPALSTTFPHPHLIFVYGTLKRGFPNHTLLSSLIATNDAHFHGSNYRTLNPFPLVCGPFRVPFLLHLPGQGHRVWGELYSLSDLGLERVDELEGVRVGNYERLPIEVGDDEGGEVVAEGYFGNRSYGEAMWRRCGEKGIARYEEEEAKGYVGRAGRPAGVSFLEHIWNFIGSGPDEDDGAPR
ncbi:hypothetical protein Droror1_Dr00009560 [Drosera rotundifolia]